MAQLYVNATLFTGEAFIEDHGLMTADGKIVDLVNLRQPTPSDVEIIDCHGGILAPGFIDLQVNGGDNILLNGQPTTEAVLAIAAAHRRFGTTSLLPTCITDRPEVMAQAIAATRAARRHHPGILGIHLEGPHLSATKRGVHAAKFIRSISDADWQLYRPEADEVMLMTIAPETVSLIEISKLKSQGIIVGLGHTEVTAAQAKAAFAAGASGVTHLFNAMSGMTARQPGLSGVALDHAESYAGLIADGIHVSDEMLRLAVRAKGAERLFLVSDAMPPAAATAPSDYSLYGETVKLEGKRCVSTDGKLSGAALTLGECVRYAIQHARIPPELALRMASTTPAEFVGLGHKLGKLLPGYQADLVLLDEQFKVHPHHVMPAKAGMTTQSR